MKSCVCTQERGKNIHIRRISPNSQDSKRRPKKHNREEQPGARGPLDLLRAEGPGLQASANKPGTASCLKHPFPAVQTLPEKN